MPERLTIGQRLKIWREKRGLSQHQLAVKVGTTQPYISDLENDSVSHTITMLNKIGKVLGFTLETFFSAQPEGRQSLDKALRRLEESGDELLDEVSAENLEQLATIFDVMNLLKKHFSEDSMKSHWSSAKIISRDPSLTFRIWNEGKNRYRLRGKEIKGPQSNEPIEIKHIYLALSALGIIGAGRVAAQEAQEQLLQIMSFGCKNYDRAFWCQGILTAHLMVRLAKIIDIPSKLRPYLFRVGLLLDVGTLIMQIEKPEVVKEVWSICGQETRFWPYARGETFAYNQFLHANVGARVMQDAQWQEFEIETTKFHHAPRNAGKDHRYLKFIQCAHIADVISTLLIFSPTVRAEDLNIDKDAFDLFFGGKNIDLAFLQEVIEDVIKEAEEDEYNLKWIWPGYSRMLESLAPSMTRRHAPQRSQWHHRTHTYKQWLDHNKREVVYILQLLKNEKIMFTA